MGIIKNFFIAQDQALNTLVKLSDGWGCPDEMLSARAWRLREAHPRLLKYIDKLFFWDKAHCEECYAIEVAKRQLPSIYSKPESNTST